METLVFVFLACLASVIVAAPQLGQQQDRPPHIAIIRDDRQDFGDGNFIYEFVSENGIVVTVLGTPGSRGQSNIQGSYRFPLPDGTFATVLYVADENGYRPESDLIPTTPPVPDHAQEQIRVAEEQRRQGVVWDQRGFRVNRK
ncbi:cuticle protein AMP4-like [Homarus americanus]|uniref:cuticle protein AMP4-like n=1 Tax=Homarus americanus TaxID=6706 RepID=UPI001C476452|nr:cuticle protein AMP4-like [Homarus americanus]